MTLDDRTRTELEAAAFRHLVGHLQERTDVQNIDLMNLAGFCRNCLAKWYLAAADGFYADQLQCRADGAEMLTEARRDYFFSAIFFAPIIFPRLCDR